ncbi:ankyrin repeat domain-containing protein, partial [Delphinella strobiligena]
LQAAAMKGHAQMAQLLMDAGADINQTGGPYGNALQAAAYCGHIEVMAAFLDRSATVALLLQRGVDVNAVGYHYGTALQAASRCGHIKMVRSLLEAGANVNILQGRHQTALCAAIVGCHVDVVKTLIKAGADTSLHFIEFGLFGNALHLAAFSGNASLVQLLLDRGADINAYGGHFGSALFATLEG